MEDVFKFKNLTDSFRNAETLNRSNMNSVKYVTETITSFGKFCLMTTKSQHLYHRINPKLENGKQINALADYAKHISSELVLFD